MNLLVVRMWFTPKSTCGIMSWDGVGNMLYTLEPAVKTDGSKPRCTPDGTYRVIIAHSPHFGRQMPLVLDVPGFEGILFHWGNHPQDTEGCTIVGKHHGDDLVTESKAAFEVLFPLLQAAEDHGEDNWVTYQSHPSAVPPAGSTT